jgi:hypothetical protein
MMDAEKRLLLLHLKSDLKEILNLTRAKSEELITSVYSDTEKSFDMAEDLEYYISSLLDITREMKSLFNDEVPVIDLKPVKLDVNSNEFDEFLVKLSEPGDVESLKEILSVLETWEFYELCAKVNEKLKAVTVKAV